MVAADNNQDLQNHVSRVRDASHAFNGIGLFFGEILNMISRFPVSSSNLLLQHISPLCPPIAYLLYAVAELLKGLMDLILLCVPAHFTHNESEFLSVSERILRAITSFIIAGFYGFTALLFLHLNPIGWIFAAVGTGIGWIKNDRGTDRHYSGLFVSVGMVLLAVNTFVFSPILFPSLGLYSIAAAGYACMIPSFLKGVVSLTKAICSLGNYLGRKLCECFCSPALDSEILAEAASTESTSKQSIRPLSRRSQPSRPDTNHYSRVLSPRRWPCTEAPRNSREKDDKIRWRALYLIK